MLNINKPMRAFRPIALGAVLGLTGPASGDAWAQSILPDLRPRYEAPPVRRFEPIPPEFQELPELQEFDTRSVPQIAPPEAAPEDFFQPDPPPEDPVFSEPAPDDPEFAPDPLASEPQPFTPEPEAEPETEAEPEPQPEPLAPDPDAEAPEAEEEATDPDQPEQLIEQSPPPAPAQPAPAPAPPEAAPAAPAPAAPATVPNAPAAEPEVQSSVTPAEPRISPLRLGILPARDGSTTIKALEPLTRRLSQDLDRAVEILPMASYRALIDAQMLQRVDGGFYSASSYAAAEALCKCLEPLVAPAADDGTTAYHAVIVTMRGAGIAALADLEGKRIATAAPSSVGGRRMQLAGLMAEGYDLRTSFGSVRTVPSPTDAVRLLLAGEVDAAFAWSSMQGDEAEGYSRGTLNALVASGEMGMDEIQIVWRSPPISHGPAAVSRSLPDATKAAIRQALLDLDVEDPAAYDEVSPLYGGGFMEVNDAAFSGVALLAQQDVDRALPPPATVEGPVAPLVLTQGAETPPR